MNRVVLTVLGYVLMTAGILSLILGTIGLRLQPISYIDKAVSPLTAFIIKLLMVIVGIVLFYRSRMNPADYE
jgi:uncharacterized membrane protein